MNILFLCVGNSARSQIAEGLAVDMFGHNHTIKSAGSAPVGEVHPSAVKTLKDIGIDISSNKSKSINDLQKQVEAATVQAGSTNSNGTNSKNEGDDNDMEGEDSVITRLDSNSVALTFGSTYLNNSQPTPTKISPLPSPQMSQHG